MPSIFYIVSPKYSFINFNIADTSEKCCMGDNIFCLPVVNDDDIIFQFNLNFDTLANTNHAWSAPHDVVKLSLLDVTGAELHNWTTTDSLYFEKYRTGLTSITYIWRNGLTGLADLIACDKCFSLHVSADFTLGGTAHHKDATSNCLIRKCNDCFTSVIEYYNDDDYAEFEYCNITDAINRIRLPLFLNQPKVIEDKAVYRKSNGVIKQTRSLLTKEYQCTTEHFPEEIHDKLTVALAHDTVNIISGSYIGGISKSGDYTIEWIDTLCKAPASFKALATPFAIRNNNCADCQVVALPECIAPHITDDWTLPDAVNGVIYDAHINVLGTAPFTLSDIIKPSWMTINVVGNAIYFGGTPPTTTTDLAISFTISNCNDTTLAYSDSINVNNPAYGRIELTCPDPTYVGHEDITFGSAGLAWWNPLFITVITPGYVLLTAFNNQTGTAGAGKSMYGQRYIYVNSGDTVVDFQTKYDGGGIHAPYDITFELTDSAGTQTCGPYSSNFTY